MLAVKNLSVHINHQAILQGISFSIDAGVLSVIGPSGAGKSTLLHAITGIQSHDGTIELSGKKTIGFVTQQSTLLPHVTIFENIALPLRLRKLPKPEINKKVSALLEQFGIANLANRLPQNISGGEQQRVSIARALIYQPSLLLLDEPFGSLDALWRYDLLTWLKTTLAAQPVPTLFVTHDQREARFISEQVLCLIHGQIAYHGSWAQIQQVNNPAMQQLLAKSL